MFAVRMKIYKPQIHHTKFVIVKGNDSTSCKLTETQLLRNVDKQRIYIGSFGLGVLEALLVVILFLVLIIHQGLLSIETLGFQYWIPWMEQQLEWNEDRKARSGSYYTRRFGIVTMFLNIHHSFRFVAQF
jgi:hypothetical protein